MPVIDTRYSFQPIKTAPDLERVMVAGIQPRTATCRAYWWYEEDVVSDGKGIEKPHATHWAPLVIPPFPHDATPTTKEGGG